MAPRPVIIDCDPGTDDAMALLLAVASPELDLRAITVVGGNVGLERTLANALALAALAGSAAPVHAGADRPLLGGGARGFETAPHVHGDNGMGGVALPPGGAPAPGLASDVIRDALRASDRPITLVGIGPATNLALALATEPALAAKVGQVVLMTGAWGEGNITPSAEFNALNDPEALAALLAAGRPLCLVTLDLTNQALVTPARVAALARRGGGRCLRAACDILAAVPMEEGRAAAGYPLHDPCAVAWLIRPSLFTARDCPVTIDLGTGPSRGRTVIDRRNRAGFAPNATVLETVDADGFFDLLGERLATLP